MFNRKQSFMTIRKKTTAAYNLNKFPEMHIIPSWKMEMGIFVESRFQRLQILAAPTQEMTVVWDEGICRIVLDHLGNCRLVLLVPLLEPKTFSLRWTVRLLAKRRTNGSSVVPFIDMMRARETYEWLIPLSLKEIDSTCDDSK